MTDDEGTDDLLKSVAMTTKSKQSTIARLAQPEPDDPDECKSAELSCFFINTNFNGTLLVFMCSIYNNKIHNFLT